MDPIVIILALVLIPGSGLLGAWIVTRSQRRQAEDRARAEAASIQARRESRLFIVAMHYQAAKYYADENDLDNWEYVSNEDALRGHSLRRDQIIYTPTAPSHPRYLEILDAAMLATRK